MSDCIEHAGCVDKDGYGWIKRNGKSQRAHRVAWEKANSRPVPAGMFVLHSCDNPTCVNPDHLRIGTHQENVDEKVQRQRQTKGESVTSSRLKESDIVAIRGMHAFGNCSLNQIAKKFGVSKNCIWKIVTMVNWRHVK